MRYYWIVVLLAGCTASNWTKEGATTADLDRDYDDCRDIGKLDTGLAALAGAFGAIGVFVGNTVKDGNIRTCLQARGWTVGPVDAKLAEAPATTAAPTPAKPAAPAAVQVSTTTSETPSAQRLRELKTLSDQGLITKEEYEAKRQAILRGL
jgi:hypothetical protein